MQVAERALDPQRADCDDCTEAYDGDPPCATCELAVEGPELWVGNHLVWQLWSTCHAHGRDGMTGVLRLDALLALAQLWRAGEATVERVLALERELWPKIRPKGEG